VGDAEALPLPDDSFDRVSSNGVLHHTPDIGAALREVRRVLKPGGEARVILYNRDSLHYWLEQVAVRGVLQGRLLRSRSMNDVLSSGVERSSVDARPLVRVYSPRQAARLMRAAGLVGVTTSVRHFRPENSRVTERLARRMTRLGDPAVQDRIGRRAGWYVIARGTKPS
jgi:ubiquinone/menaquinone biosynthesis C-methylase UbiE